MFAHTGAYALLPATQALFNGKLKVTMNEMAAMMGGGTLILVKDHNGKEIVLSSAGRMELTADKWIDGYHDQLLRPFPRMRVVSVHVYSLKDGEPQTETPFVPGKFPLYVFK